MGYGAGRIGQAAEHVCRAVRCVPSRLLSGHVEWADRRVEQADMSSGLRLSGS